jgi:Holliday junction DNA helicase RuvA
MIYFLSGKIFKKSENFLVVKNNDIGFKIFVHKKIINSLEVGQSAFLFIYFYFKENNVELYGFLDEKELEFFEMLNSVNGVVPKLALAILEKNDLKTLSLAIKNNKTEFLTKASGVGQKTAERIILELKNKIKIEDSEGLAQNLDIDFEIIEALVNLGYSKQQAKNAVLQVDSKFKTFEERFKQALKILNKK